jgi:hypothetical protein
MIPKEESLSICDILFPYILSPASCELLYWIVIKYSLIITFIFPGKRGSSMYGIRETPHCYPNSFPNSPYGLPIGIGLNS